LPCAICAASAGIVGDVVSAARAGSIPLAWPHNAAAKSVAPPALIHCFIMSVLLADC
jgi:hypothetical protein